MTSEFKVKLGAITHDDPPVMEFVTGAESSPELVMILVPDTGEALSADRKGRR